VTVQVDFRSELENQKLSFDRRGSWVRATPAPPVPSGERCRWAERCSRNRRGDKRSYVFERSAQLRRKRRVTACTLSRTVDAIASGHGVQRDERSAASTAASKATTMAGGAHTPHAETSKHDPHRPRRSVALTALAMFAANAQAGERSADRLRSPPTGALPDLQRDGHAIGTDDLQAAGGAMPRRLVQLRRLRLREILSRRARRWRRRRPHLQGECGADRNALDVDLGLRTTRRSHADAWLCRDA
jgi:hypothetical protein